MRVTGYVDVPMKLRKGINNNKRPFALDILESIASRHIRGQDHVGLSVSLMNLLKGQ